MENAVISTWEIWHVRPRCASFSVTPPLGLCAYSFYSLRKTITFLTRALSSWVKLIVEAGSPVQISYIQDMLSEPSIQPQSQMSFGDTSVDATGHAILPAGRTQAKQHIETKPRFAEFMCTRYEVWAGLSAWFSLMLMCEVGDSIFDPCYEGRDP